VGIALLFRMGREAGSGRGGDWSDRLDAFLAKLGRKLPAGRRTTQP
jgi:hypothetical protein